MATKKTKKDGVNKSAYIRKYPSLKPAELVAKAKAESITITPGLIYAIRSSDKNKGGAKAAPKGVKRASTAAGGSSLDAVVRSIVREEIKAFFASK